MLELKHVEHIAIAVKKLDEPIKYYEYIFGVLTELCEKN